MIVGISVASVNSNNEVNKQDLLINLGGNTLKKRPMQGRFFVNQMNVGAILIARSSKPG